MLMMLVYVARALAPRTQASAAQLGIIFSLVGAFDASLQIHTHIHIPLPLHIHIHVPLHMHFKVHTHLHLHTHIVHKHKHVCIFSCQITVTIHGAKS